MSKRINKSISTCYRIYKHTNKCLSGIRNKVEANKVPHQANCKPRITCVNDQVIDNQGPSGKSILLC
ncbi:hypothetical protein RIR_jg9659.t1 [Rhizophagus irregularis DAOM 181602=DAOM 197198]|nr:hypothetical protein RIR_jg9659.t1 [Rhizophagus irregularis DAOM 181602=DAOM 197198]